MVSNLDEERLVFERVKHADEIRLAEARLAQDAARAEWLSPGMVATVGALIALISSGLTAALGGLFQIQTERMKTEKEIALEDKRVNAELETMRQEQQFNILLRATEDVPVEDAAKNLKFFVDIGYLNDPTGQIKEYAARGEAPRIATSGNNPLLERMAEVARATPPSPQRSGQRFFIENHVLAGLGSQVVQGVPTQNYATIASRRYVVLHATAAPALAAIKQMREGTISASNHLIVARDGSVTQLLPFDLAAFHVGRARWGSTLLQRNSIAISLENWEQLRQATNGWETHTGTPVPASEVTLVTNPEGTQTAFQSYTSEQITAVIDIILALRETYPELVDVIGHGDAEPRKADPGPAFPLAKVRSATFGREEALEPD